VLAALGALLNAHSFFSANARSDGGAPEGPPLLLMLAAIKETLVRNKHTLSVSTNSLAAMETHLKAGRLHVLLHLPQHRQRPEGGGLQVIDKRAARDALLSCAQRHVV
jgi:hypothetical protein